MILNMLKNKCTSKQGSEILQSIMVIAIIGAMAITMITIFKTELYNSLGLKLADSTYDYAEEDASGDIGTSIINSGKYDNKETISYNK